MARAERAEADRDQLLAAIGEEGDLDLSDIAHYMEGLDSTFCAMRAPYLRRIAAAVEEVHRG